eukprot:snap_masked-scaffold_46-processed-gene-1.31-mRNA-1 protein AED:1.00 eAED:1.00 QI:0/-1/0/0/-1/1/1/0/121
MSAPTADTFSEARRTLGYLFDAKYLVLKYDTIKLKNNLKMFLYSSFSNALGILSVHEFVNLLNDNLITVRSKLEPVVVNNSTEAEYFGINLALQKMKRYLLSYAALIYIFRRLCMLTINLL